MKRPTTNSASIAIAPFLASHRASMKLGHKLPRGKARGFSVVEILVRTAILAISIVLVASGLRIGVTQTPHINLFWKSASERAQNAIAREMAEQNRLKREELALKRRELDLPEKQ